MLRHFFLLCCGQVLRFNSIKKKCRVGVLFCFCFVLYPIGCGDVFYGGFVVILFLLGAKKKQISIFDVTFAINNCI